MKIVINACFGGFSLSSQAMKWLAERGHSLATKELVAWTDGNGRRGSEMNCSDIARDDPLLIQCVEALGEDAASGACAELSIEEVDVNSAWWVQEYDGLETLHVGAPDHGVRLLSSGSDEEE